MKDRTSQLTFMDSNIWLYSFIRTQDSDKTEIAQKVIQNSKIVLSVQVINEVCVNLIKKFGFKNSEVEKLIDSFYESYEVCHFEKETLTKATKLRKNYKLSFWDSLIVASALKSKAKFLFSEDMQNDLVIEETLTIKNPFKK